MCLLQPTIFFALSTPWLAAGTLVNVLTDCASYIAVDGSGTQPARVRTLPRAAINLLGGAVLLPRGVVVIHALVGREVVREQVHGAPSPVDIQDRVDDLSQVVGRRGAAGGVAAARWARQSSSSGAIRAQRSSDRSVAYGLRSVMTSVYSARKHRLWTRAAKQRRGATETKTSRHQTPALQAPQRPHRTADSVAAVSDARARMPASARGGEPAAARPLSRRIRARSGSGQFAAWVSSRPRHVPSHIDSTGPTTAPAARLSQLYPAS